MKNVVLKLDLHHDRAKQKALSAVSGLSGVDSISVDMNDKKMTVTGDIDPVHVVSKLRKFCYTEIVSVVSVKDNEKKEEPEKDEPKKVDEKQANDMAAALKAYQAYTNYPQITAYYHVRAADKDYYYPYYHIGSAEENPNACVIC